MKKTLLSIMVLVFILGSINVFAKSIFKDMFKTKYFDVDLGLNKVIREPELIESEALLSKNHFKDEIINILWFPHPVGFSFTVINKLNKTITIIWDESSYIDTNNNAYKIIHKGTKYMHSDQSQLPTQIPILSKLNDIVHPTPDPDSVLYRGTYTQQKSLRVLKKSILKKYPKKERKIQKKLLTEDILKKNFVKSIEDNVYRVLLTFKISNKKYQYHFFFNSRVSERISGAFDRKIKPKFEFIDKKKKE